MKCSRCGGVTRVVDTRHQDNVLTIRRRRSCIDALCRHQSWTIEIHEAAAGASHRVVAAHAATLRGRWAMLARDKAIAAELHRGWQLLAARYGITKGAVYLAAKRGRRKP